MLAFESLGLFESLGTYWLVIDWAIRAIALYVVPRNRKPSAGTAWLLLIFLLPLPGMLLFIILGSPKLPESRRSAQKTLDGFISRTLKYFQNNRDSKDLLSPQAPTKYLPIAKLSHSLSRFPVFAGNELVLLPEYNDAISKIVSDIKSAKHYIHLEYFIITYDEITEPLLDALAQAVERGVVVRVMYDSLSTKRYPGHKQMVERLNSSGVQVQAMLPFNLPGRGYVRPDLRNHRKLVIIDGHTGYTGSQNLIKRNYHRKDEIYYDELVVRLRGPIVLQLEAVFLTDWYSETGKLLDFKDIAAIPDNIKSYGTSLAQVLPSGPGYEDENNLKLFTSLIHAAQTKITIVNPYFVPDEALTTAITSATKRGVEVTMVNSEVIDQWMVGHAQRSFYEALLSAGVKIYLYKKPILLHSKYITIDDEVATIGSSNLDIRSFQLDLEVTLIAYDAKLVRQLGNLEKKYLERSNEIKLEQWLARSRWQKLLENIARLTSALQ